MKNSIHKIRFVSHLRKLAIDVLAIIVFLGVYKFSGIHDLWVGFAQKYWAGF